MPPVSPAEAGRFFTTEPPGKPCLKNLDKSQNKAITKDTCKEPPLPLGFSRQEYWSVWPLIGDTPLICDTSTLTPIGLWVGIHFGEMLHAPVGKGPRAGQVRKKKPDNRLKLHKDLEVLPYINEFLDNPAPDT